MDVNGYLVKMERIQNRLLEFLDKNDDFETDLHQFTTFLSDENIQGEIFKEFLNLISKISTHHHRTTCFIKKIESILTFLKKDILASFSNSSIFNAFRDNKIILHFLFQNKFITVDEYIYNFIVNQNINEYYFAPELIGFMAKETQKVEESFEENRTKGENASYICQLIRNDSIEEFVAYTSKTNLPIKSAQIEQSCFETNHFLLEKRNVSLIEYAAFFGSIQIVKYMQINDVELEPSLWLFAIHSNSPELIHFLEDNKVLPADTTYKECFEESVKCYHNNIAYYIQDNLLQVSMQNEDSSELIKFYNFSFLPKYLENENFYHCFCRYDYLFLTNIMAKTSNINKAINDIYL